MKNYVEHDENKKKSIHMWWVCVYAIDWFSIELQML